MASVYPPYYTYTVSLDNLDKQAKKANLAINLRCRSLGPCVGLLTRKLAIAGGNIEYLTTIQQKPFKQ